MSPLPLCVLCIVYLLSFLQRNVYASRYIDEDSAFVENFKCKCVNFEYMTCSFNKLYNTEVMNIYYYTEIRPHLKNKQQLPLSPIYKCTVFAVNGNEISWDLRKNECKLCTNIYDCRYIPNSEFYMFNITSIDAQGRVRHTSKEINQHDIVQPIISEFKVENITMNSCVLTWEMETYMYYKLKRLQTYVTLNISNFVRKISKTCKERKCMLPLQDLPYAYYTYNVSLRLKMDTQAAIWSPIYSREFRTLSRAAETPPVTDIGSFHVSNRHVRLFWRPVEHENGSNFQYVVRKVQQDDAPVKDVASSKPLQVNRNSALFEWQRDHSYEFTIRSHNDAGTSERSSRIVVPTMLRSDRSPLRIRSVYNGFNKTYTLSWTAPIDKENLMNYTVFWCHPRSGISNECNSIIDFTHLSKDDLQYTMSATDRLVLAVSANYKDSYTGMHWSECTVDADSDVIKLKPNISEVTAYTIKLNWSLEGTNYNVTIENGVDRFLLRDLKSFSVYKIEMLINSGMKVGPLSDPLKQRTLAAAPLPPRNLTLKEITNTSALISWLPPEEANGCVIYYIITQNHEKHTLECDKILGNMCNICSNDKEVYGRYANEAITFKLEHLTGFTNYSVYVTAHTNTDKLMSSAPSNRINFQTLIGVPSSPEKVILEIGKDDVILQWEKPLVPSGRLEFYELIVTTWFKDEQQMCNISSVIGSNAYIISKPRCSDNYKYTVGVRAVNVATLDSSVAERSWHVAHRNISETEKLALLAEYSNRSLYVQYRSAVKTAPIYICVTASTASDFSFIARIIGLVIVVVIVMILFYRKWKRMTSIECKLPSGLILSSVSSIADNTNDIIDSDEKEKELYDKLISSNDQSLTTLP